MSQIIVPLNKLILSPRNVRKTPVPDVDIESLADSIASKGLLQNLVVSEGTSGKGIYEVDAGGCRLRALEVLVSRKTIARNHPVPCLVIPRDDAREASLAENSKFAMNPADEVTAYREIIEQYADHGIIEREAQIANLAHRFGKTVRYVEQRLRLAALAPDVLEALRTERITLDAARAYAGHPDHEQQLKIFAVEEKKGEWGHSPTAIKDALKGKIYAADHKAVLYVGLDAYLAAGGRVERDLFFGAEDREVLLDPSIVDRLCGEKAAAEAQSLALARGWQDGAVRPWSGPDYAEPKVPKGFVKRWGGLPASDDVGRANAITWFKIADDGAGLEQYESACFVPATPAAAPGAARATSVDHEEIWRARARKLEIETSAARLAMPSIAGTPLEGRTHWPAQQHGIQALSHDDETGDFVIAMLVRIPATDVAAMREKAEWEIAERESAGAAEEAKSKTAPAETPAPTQAKAKARVAETVS